jgi:hypothetical protein
MWATGAGSGVMKRIAAPMVGGIFSSFLLELLVYPVIYEIWKARSLEKSAQETRHAYNSKHATDLTLTPPSPAPGIPAD